VIKKILTHLDNKSTSVEVSRLPPCRGPPRTFQEEAPSSSLMGMPPIIAGWSILREFTTLMSEPSLRLWVLW
jgi:hypothetical protein